VRWRERKKKVLLGERQPPFRSELVSQAWAVDLLFERTTEGLVRRVLAIVHDAMQEAAAINVQQATYDSVTRAWMI